MADVKLNTLPQSTSPTSTQDLLLFDESTNAGQRINYNTLADAILAKLTSKTYTVGGGTQTLISAIDVLNSKLTLTGEYNDAGSFSSAETLGSKLDALLNAQSSYVIACYRLSCTASFGVFQNGYDYCVQMTRANSLNFVMAEFTPIDNALIKILGKRRTDGWSFELAPSRTEINTLNSNLTNTLKSGANNIENLIVGGYSTGSGNYFDLFVPLNTSGKDVTAASVASSTVVFLPSKRIEFSSAPTITVLATTKYGVRLELAFPSTQAGNAPGTIYLIGLTLTCS